MQNTLVPVLFSRPKEENHDAPRRRMVGATAIGPMGGEVIGALTLAVHAEVPLDTLKSMIYAYPTFHRGIEDALHHLA